jgi:hypothetical protein
MVERGIRKANPGRVLRSVKLLEDEPACPESGL